MESLEVSIEMIEYDANIGPTFYVEYEDTCFTILLNLKDGSYKVFDEHDEESTLINVVGGIPSIFYFILAEIYSIVAQGVMELECLNVVHGDDDISWTDDEDEGDIVLADEGTILLNNMVITDKKQIN